MFRVLDTNLHFRCGYRGERIKKLGLFYHHDRGELRKAEHQYRASLAIKRDEVVLNELGTLLEDQADLLRDAGLADGSHNEDTRPREFT